MSPTTVPQYGIHDFSLNSDSEHANPFMVNVHATFEHESGEKIENVPGFYNGDGQWVVRFWPTLSGEWQGRTESDDPNLGGVPLGPVECVGTTNASVHGGLGLDPASPRTFAWQDGTPFVLLGFECDWLFAYHQRHPEDCRKQVNAVADCGFNYVVMNIYAHTGFGLPDKHGKIMQGKQIAPAEFLYGPPDRYVFGGTNDNPDHSVLNVDFFKDYDTMMRILHERGVVAHLMIQVQNKAVNWPARRSAEDDLFWKYVVARYQAFGNVVWDIGKESYNLLKETGSHDYTIDRIGLIRKTDAYRRLVTVHDSEQKSAGRESAADLACDFSSDQIHLRDVAYYNREAIRRLRNRERPYLNIEYGYEYGVDDYKIYAGHTTSDWRDILTWTWAFYAAGAYACYYYNNTSWDLIKFEPQPPGWQRYRYVRETVDGIPYNRMSADNELVEYGHCLAAPGECYLVYLPRGGDLKIDLSALPHEAAVSCEWLDIFSGVKEQVEGESKGFCTMLENPLSDTAQPCVAVVRAR